MPDHPDLPARFENVEPWTDTPIERSFCARDRVLGRDVLVKLPARQAAETWSAKVKERLLRQAQAIAKIRHDNIATVYWVEETAAGPLLVLDRPEGETLAEKLERGPLDPTETIELGIHVAEALAEVHHAGIVHRCIGPSAIRFLPSGRVQLGAFTFAKELGAREDVSSLHHHLRGEPELARLLPDYSAPEQLVGENSEPRSDIYALGCTLYRALAGRDAFEPGKELEPMPDLQKARPDVGRPLAEVIRKCAMPSKSARFSNARQVADALRALQAPRAVAATEPGSRRTGMLALAAVAATTAVLLGIFGSDLWRDSAASTPRGGENHAAGTDRRYERTYGKDYQRVHGLFVGIGAAYADTDWPVLRNPAREVAAVAAQLRANDPQWATAGSIQTLVEHEATYAAITAALDRLVQTAGTEDAVLIYFAGHGQKDGRSFGLCTADVDGSIQNGTNYLRRDVLGTYLDRLQAKHALVVLDCCHSGAVFDEPTRGRDPERSIDKHPGGHHRRKFSREFLCSAAAGQLAADGADLSPFAQQLLRQLRQPATAEQQYVAARYLSARIAEAMDQKVAHSSRMQVARFRQMAEQEGSFVFRLGKGK